jgi:1-acyl-sn-glycerol-3-phosphate acyltransferase
MRKVICFLNLIVSTIFFSLVAILASVLDSRGEAVHRVAWLWATIHLKVCGIAVDVQGIGHLTSPPFIIMCNHQSALDIYALHAALPTQYKWIAKRSLFMIPIFGWALKRAGYISLDRENPREGLKAMDEAARKIREGMNIIIFPEGTRSRDGKLLPFKKGGFSLALKAGVPIVPVGIAGTSALQPKGSFVPKTKGVIYVRVGEPLSLKGLTKGQATKVMEEMRGRIERLVGCRET